MEIDVKNEDFTKCFNCSCKVKCVEDKTVDVVVTSPPYNIGTKYSRYKDKKEKSEYLDGLIYPAVNNIKRVLKDNGSFFFNIGGKPSDYEFPMQVIDFIVKDGFKIQNMIHWIKNIYVENETSSEIEDNSFGHFKPINSNRFVNDTHEYIVHFTKNKNVKLDRLAIGVPYKDNSNEGRWKSRSKVRCRGNCWFIPYKTVQSKKLHPASFPLELPRRCIALHGCSEETVVMDPFMGSGITGIAAKMLGCKKFIGYEIDKQYIDMFYELLGVKNQL